MAALNTQLQDYLSKSSKSSLLENNGSSDNGSNYFSWFSKKSQPEIDDTTNGWLSEAQKDPLLPSLTKTQRVVGFIGCLLMGTFCFSLASLYIPFLIVKARKFAMLYTLGSLFVIFSFSLLWGPTNHVKHLFSAERLPFTTAYFGTLVATLYFSLWVKSTLFTVICAVVQILALVWYIVSYIPGGQTGLRFFSRIFYGVASKTASKTIPV